MAPFAQGVVGNPTGSHRASRAARAALDDAREEIASLTGALPGGVVFTGGGTESCNLAVFGVAADRARRGRPARLVVSSIEHHAVLDACDRLGRGLLAVDVAVVRLPVTENAIVALDAVRELAVDADLVSVMTANNEVGTVQPIPAIAAAVRDVAPRAVVHSDAVAAAPWLDLTEAAAGADFAHDLRPQARWPRRDRRVVPATGGAARATAGRRRPGARATLRHARRGWRRWPRRRAAPCGARARGCDGASRRHDVTSSRSS